MATVAAPVVVKRHTKRNRANLKAGFLDILTNSKAILRQTGSLPRLGKGVDHLPLFTIVPACIKSEDTKKPDLFDRAFCIEHIIYSTGTTGFEPSRRI
jgi:hypothetical protein